MDAFSYLSVLLSVILGLAIQQVLMGYRALALSRRNVRWYWPSIAWSGIILAMVAQHWWASFGLADRPAWSFAAFATILVQTALIYMMAALVLPDVPPKEEIDLKAHYYREAPVFFAVGSAVVAWSLLREAVLQGALPQPANLAFHGLFLMMSLTATLTRREWLHKAFAVAMSALFLLYIALLFSQLD